MQSANDLKQLLFNINHKSYPAYKSARGAYQFPNYILSIDHVQGDPFAAPSRVSSMSPEKLPHFRRPCTTRTRSASLFRITCCASLHAQSHRIPSVQRDPAKADCLA